MLATLIFLTDRIRIPFFPLPSMLEKGNDDVFLDGKKDQLRKDAETKVLAGAEKKPLFFAKSETISLASNY